MSKLKEVENITIQVNTKDLYKISDQNLKDYIKTATDALEQSIKTYYDTVNNLPRIRETVKFMLDHKDEYEQLEYANLSANDLTAYYRVICNGEYSYNCDIEANAKEGWIIVIVYNLKDKPKTDSNFLYISQFPYITKVNGELEVAKMKIFGDVVIFRLDPYTQQPIRKKNI